MFVPFLIFTGIILVGGPGHIEGGIETLQEKPVKEVVSDTWKEREAVDYSKMND